MTTSAAPDRAAAAGVQRPRNRRNMIVLRAGDESLHPTWLRNGSPRNWDLHISYFGSKGAPAGADSGDFTWSQDGGRSKWAGLNDSLAKQPFDIDAYDFISTPDDDLVVAPETWNRAFDIAAEHDLAISQLSLDHASFYSHGITLHRPGLKLRFVNVVEYMPPIFRRDAFKKLVALLPDPQNLWGIEFVMASYFKDTPRSMAIIDAATVLHTRAPGVSTMYKHMRSGGQTMEAIEQAYLDRHGATKVKREVVGALDAAGRDISNLTLARRPIFRTRLLKAYRALRKIERIAPVYP